MNREEAKKLLPIIQAFAEGKTVQYKNYEGKWEDTPDPEWYSGDKYRIKPEPKYDWAFYVTDGTGILFKKKLTEEEAVKYRRNIDWKVLKHAKIEGSEYVEA